MADAIVVELRGEPLGKGRPRFARLTGRAYTPARTRLYERNLAWAAKSAMRGRKPLDGPLKVIINALFGVPKSWTQKRRTAALNSEIRPIKKPDWDNVAKVIDALNGIVWLDDCQVVEGTVIKSYSSRPALLVTVFPIISTEA